MPVVPAPYWRCVKLRRQPAKYGLDVVKSEIRSVDDLAGAIEAFKGRAEALYFCPDPYSLQIGGSLLLWRLARGCRQCLRSASTSKQGG